MDILSAMRCVDMEWNACPSEVIANCFQYGLKRGNSLKNGESGVDNDKTLIIMEKDECAHGVTVCKSGLAQLITSWV